MTTPRFYRYQTDYLDQLNAMDASFSAAVQAGTDSVTQAGIATTQAGIATAQAGIATTQAGIATAQASSAQGNANAIAGVNTAVQGYMTQSANSALQALSARDAAITASQVAANPTEILAAMAQTIHSGNVVAACLMDVSRDSDGGASIKRETYTSWYSEPICTGSWLKQAANELAARGDNMLAAPEEFDNAAWTKSIGGTGVNPAVTPNNALAPNGTMTADTVTFNTGAGGTVNDLSYLLQSTATMANGVYADTVCVKGTAGQQLLIRGAAGGNHTLITLDGTWQTITIKETATGANSFTIGLRQGTSVGNVNTSVTVAIWYCKRNQVGQQSSTYSGSPELVTNGSGTSGATGWTGYAGSATIASAGGGIEVTYTGTTSLGRAEQAIATTIGKVYALTVTAISKTGSATPAVRLGSTSGQNETMPDVNVAVGSSMTSVFVAKASTTYLDLTTGTTNVTGDKATFTVSIKEVTVLATPYVPYSSLVGSFYQNTTDGKFYSLNATYGQTEVFRGNNRERPALGLVAAEASRVVIYDATKPGCPMWMVFTSHSSSELSSKAIPGGNITGVTYINGQVLISASDTGSWFAGLWTLDFIKDVATRMYKGTTNTGTFQKPSNLALRNTEETFVKVSSNAPVALLCNAVAATVLPDAPVDPATGLPVPTIALATTGGVSVIKNDWTVVNSSFTSSVDQIAFNQRGDLIWGRAADARYFYVRAGAYGTAAFANSTYTNGGIPSTLVALGTPRFSADGAMGNGNGLLVVKENPANPLKTMVAGIFTGYNTGWMVGDIRGCFFADTVAETIAASGNLVANGDFSSGTTTGWVSGSTTATAAVVSGEMQVTATQNFGRDVYALPALTVGRTYVLTGTGRMVSGPGTAILGIASTSSGQSASANVNTASTTPVSAPLTFTATQTNYWVVAGLTTTGPDVTGSVAAFDNISVQLATPDRSVKNKGMVVNGSFNKTAVATGAQLVAFSIAAAGSYIEQPYSADQDYGTGDFGIMLELKQGTNTAVETLFERGYYTGGAYSGARFSCVVDATGKLKFTVNDGTNSASITTTNAINDGTWKIGLFVGSVSGSLVIRQNGVDLATPVSRAAVGSLNNANAVLRFYLDVSGANGAANAAMTLAKPGATAPSNDQLGTIYRDHVQMFQPGAQITLDGTSNAIVGLWYDESTDLRHAETSWGRSTHHNLVRVESAASQVGTGQGVVAGGGTHITFGSTGARFVQPAITLRDELRRKDDFKRAQGSVPYPFWFTGDGTNPTFSLPKGYMPRTVQNGLFQREGSSYDYTTSFDGYQWSVTFNSAPKNNANICIMGVRYG
jgi:hypothetical protein